jgi:hypothetical protein
MASRRLSVWFLIKYKYTSKPMLAKREKSEIHNLSSVPGSNPKAIPGFSIKVSRKKSPMIGILCPGYIPSYLKLRKGIENPFTRSFET